MSEAVQCLTRWKLPTNPINFSIAYEYVSAKNEKLVLDIDKHISTEGRVDNFFFEEMYQLHILGQNNFRTGVINDIDSMVDNVHQNCSDSESSVSSFIQELDNNIGNINRSNGEQLARIATNMKKATLKVKETQQDLMSQLESSKAKADELKAELEDVRKLVFLDPLTGLYNRKAMKHEVELWYKTKGPQQIAAIVLNVDEFRRFSDNFGHLISDVILSKIAAKVSSYVDKSGLPVRYGNDEFLILLPEVEVGIASEIAEKIRQGVQKLRFVSAKSRVRLPQMTVSLGVTEIDRTEPFSHLIGRAKKALSLAQSTGHNQLKVLSH